MLDITPGEWEVVKRSSEDLGTYRLRQAVLEDEWVTDGYEIDEDEGDRRGAVAERHEVNNAKLMCKAPDLHRALEATLACLKNWMEIADDDDVRDYDFEAVAMAEAALAGASGACPACSTGTMAGPIPGMLANGERCDTCEKFASDDDVPPLVTCQLCGKPTNALTAHPHGDGYIGDECCWDERLRGSE
jgi:hypothetical protein